MLSILLAEAVLGRCNGPSGICMVWALCCQSLARSQCVSYSPWHHMAFNVQEFLTYPSFFSGTLSHLLLVLAQGESRKVLRTCSKCHPSLKEANKPLAPTLGFVFFCWILVTFIAQWVKCSEIPNKIINWDVNMGLEKIQTEIWEIIMLCF